LSVDNASGAVVDSALGAETALPTHQQEQLTDMRMHTFLARTQAPVGAGDGGRSVPISS
jgi:hypothetical protein